VYGVETKLYALLLRQHLLEGGKKNVRKVAMSITSDSSKIWRCNKSPETMPAMVAKYGCFISQQFEFKTYNTKIQKKSTDIH
jgi:hypothetical protein